MKGNHWGSCMVNRDHSRLWFMQNNQVGNQFDSEKWMQLKKLCLRRLKKCEVYLLVCLNFNHSLNQELGCRAMSLPPPPPLRDSAPCHPERQLWRRLNFIKKRPLIKQQINCSCMKTFALKLYHTYMCTCWNWQVQNTGHSSQVIVFNTNTESILTFIKANLRPKNFCLGLIRPEVRIYKCLEYFLYW